MTTTWNVEHDVNFITFCERLAENTLGFSAKSCSPTWAHVTGCVMLIHTSYGMKKMLLYLIYSNLKLHSALKVIKIYPLHTRIFQRIPQNSSFVWLFYSLIADTSNVLPFSDTWDASPVRKGGETTKAFHLSGTSDASFWVVRVVYNKFSCHTVKLPLNVWKPSPSSQVMFNWPCKIFTCDKANH